MYFQTPRPNSGIDDLIKQMSATNLTRVKSSKIKKENKTVRTGTRTSTRTFEKDLLNKMNNLMVSMSKPPKQSTKLTSKMVYSNLVYEKAVNYFTHNNYLTIPDNIDDADKTFLVDIYIMIYHTCKMDNIYIDEKIKETKIEYFTNIFMDEDDIKMFQKDLIKFGNRMQVKNKRNEEIIHKYIEETMLKHNAKIEWIYEADYDWLTHWVPYVKIIPVEVVSETLHKTPKGALKHSAVRFLLSFKTQ